MTRLPQGAGGFDLNALMKQVQQMQAEMTEAQEKLKDEVVEASAGGGMVKVKMSGDLRLLELDDRPRGDRPRGRRDAPGHGPRRGQRGDPLGAGAGAAKMGGIAGGRGGGRQPAASACLGAARRLQVVPAADQPARRRARRSCPGSASGPRSGSPSTSCAPRTTTRSALADAIREVKEKVGLCEVCFNLAEGPRCEVCEDTRRDRTLICVVEQPADVIPIERTHEYRGLYHVLGGALSPIDGVDPEDLKIAELVDRVDAAGEPVSEVVLATNPTTTGEATAHHVAELLRGGSRSPASPPACRSAPTSSTPTRSPSAAPSPAAARSAEDAAAGSVASSRPSSTRSSSAGSTPSRTEPSSAGAGSRAR